MLWDDFLNSHWHDWRGSGRSEDRLERPEWIKEWLEDHELPLIQPPDSDEMHSLKELRSFLHDMVTRIVNGSSPNQEQLRRVNHIMACGPVIREMISNSDGYDLIHKPVRGDWQQVMSEIAASFAATLADGETSRIRICDNPDCLWIYYDDTRNRSKRFCDDKMCGNLIKVRRFRARKKAAQQEK